MSTPKLNGRVGSMNGMFRASIAMLVLGAALVGWAAWHVFIIQAGVVTTATVMQCESAGAKRGVRCIGRWSAEGGIVNGVVHGAEPRDAGESIEVSLRGNEAYARRAGLPLALGGLGSLALVLGVHSLRRARAIARQ